MVVIIILKRKIIYIYFQKLCVFPFTSISIVTDISLSRKKLLSIFFIHRVLSIVKIKLLEVLACQKILIERKIFVKNKHCV